MNRIEQRRIEITDAHMERLAEAESQAGAPRHRPVINLFAAGVVDFEAHAQPLWDLRDAGLLRSTGTIGVLELTEAGGAALAAWRIVHETLCRTLAA